MKQDDFDKRLKNIRLDYMNDEVSVRLQQQWRNDILDLNELDKTLEKTNTISRVC